MIWNGFTGGNKITPADERSLNQNSSQGSRDVPVFEDGSAYGNRTRLSALRGPRPN